MTTCPECGARSWRYQGDIYTCRHGHQHRRSEGVPRPPGRPFPLRAVACAALGLSVIDLILHLL